MEDEAFLRQLKEKLETTAGTPIDLEIDREDKRHLAVELGGAVPRVVFGSDVLEFPGLARMFSQFAILCIKQRREVSELEFLVFLRRN